MQAVILAGGLGSRLKKITRTTPKPLIKVGGKPILEHQINLLKKYGVRNIIITTYYLTESIKKYFGDGRRFGVKIIYYTEKEPLGTSGALKQIKKILQKEFIVFYGDIMINMDLRRFINFHNYKKGVASLVVHPSNHPYDSDLIEIDSSQRIINIHIKPHVYLEYFRNLTNAGVYMLNRRIVDYIPSKQNSDFVKDVFNQIIFKEKIFAYNTAEYLKDIGTFQRLQEARKDWQDGKIEKFNREHQRPAIFLDRDGVINKYVGLLYNIKDFKLLPKVAETVRLINKSEFLAIVITNQPVIARNLCSIEDLELIHKKMETLLGRKNAKLDAIYYCPHHPDSGYPEENPIYKIKCNCRKPAIGLIQQAQKDFNIDLNKSYFIGDSKNDVLCGKNAGLITIVVKTGIEFPKDETAIPDYFFNNLYEAVRFILSDK